MALRFCWLGKLFDEPVLDSCVEMINGHARDYSGWSKPRRGIASQVAEDSTRKSELATTIVMANWMLRLPSLKRSTTQNSVWIACLLFFSVALFRGFGYDEAANSPRPPTRF